LTFREKQELEEVETEIARLEARKGEVETLLADPSRLSGGHRELQERTAEFTSLEARLEDLLARWEELEAKR
jgi:ATP-binding cassette subfamily F protein uup